MYFECCEWSTYGIEYVTSLYDGCSLGDYVWNQLQLKT